MDTIDQRIGRSRDRESFSGLRVRKADLFGLKQHAGSNAELLAEFIASFDSGVEIVTNDGSAVMKKVAPDLVESACSGPGLDEREASRESGEDLEICEGGLAR